MNTFSNFLKQEYLRRKEQDANFSINKFSQQLGISSGTLCRFLNGTRKITIDSAMKLGRKLNLESSLVDQLTRDMSLGNLEILDSANSAEQDRFEILVPQGALQNELFEKNKPQILFLVNQLVKLLSEVPSDQKLPIALKICKNDLTKN